MKAANSIIEHYIIKLTLKEMILYLNYCQMYALLIVNQLVMPNYFADNNSLLTCKF